MFALAFIILEILIAVFARWIAPYDPDKSDYAAIWSLPTSQALDGHGRPGPRRAQPPDLRRARLHRVGILAQLTQLLIGLPIGAIAGLVGGWVD